MARILRNNQPWDKRLTSIQRAAYADGQVPTYQAASGTFVPGAGTSSTLGVNVIYVGKHGSDANSGRNWYLAKLTFGSAVAAAIALLPTTNNRVAIVCQDAGIYVENLVAPIVPPFVSIDAPDATLQGAVDVDDDVSIVFNRVTNAGTRTVGKVPGAGGRSYARINEIVLGLGAIGVQCENGTFQVSVGTIRETAAATGLGVTAAGARLDGVFGEILTTTSWNISDAGASLNAFVGRETGANVSIGTELVTVAGVGGAFPDYWDATLGAGGEFAATDVGLAAAIAAGRQNLLFLDNVVLGADVALPNAEIWLTGRLPGTTLQAGAFRLLGGGASCRVRCTTLTATTALAGAGSLFAATLAAAEFISCTLTNTSAANSTPIVAGSTAFQSYTNVTVNVANVSTGGIVCTPATGRFEARSLNLVCGGAACDVALTISTDISGFWYGGNITGTISNGGTIFSVAIGGTNGFDISGINLGSLASAGFSDIALSGVTVRGLAATTTARLTLTGATLYECRRLEGTAIRLNGNNNVSGLRGIVIPLGTVDLLGSNDNVLYDVQCAAITNLSGDRNHLTNVRSTAGYSVAATADDTQISGGITGTPGVGTITVVALANRTNIMNHTVGVAVVDGGTDTAAVAVQIRP